VIFHSSSNRGDAARDAVGLVYGTAREPNRGRLGGVQLRRYGNAGGNDPEDTLNRVTCLRKPSCPINNVIEIRVRIFCQVLATDVPKMKNVVIARLCSQTQEDVAAAEIVPTFGSIALIVADEAPCRLMLLTAIGAKEACDAPEKFACAPITA